MTRSSSPSGEPVVRLGVQLLDDYLEVVAARCRPNTALAVAFDLKVFFTVAGKEPDVVTSADVLALISSQRAGGDGRRIRVVDERAALLSRTVARRLSTVSGLLSYLLALLSGLGRRKLEARDSAANVEQVVLCVMQGVAHDSSGVDDEPAAVVSPPILLRRREVRSKGRH